MSHDHGHDHDHHGHARQAHGDHAHAHGTNDDAHAHHGHAHHAAPADFTAAFAIGIALNLAFVLVEAVYGVVAHSMALIADAGHNLSDVLALALAWAASVLVRRGPSARFTYGLRSSSILAALFNGALLLLVTGGIAWEAVLRLLEPAPVSGATVVWVALAGLAVNGTSAMLFARGSREDINIRGAFLHMAADAAVSLATALAGVGILATGWLWLDPVAALLIAVVIVASTWALLRDSVRFALNAVPGHIDPTRVRAYLAKLEGVAEIHDLHIWGMSTTETALTAHLVMPGGHPGDAYMAEVCHALREQFHVHHPTIQIEIGDRAHPCELAPDHVV
jgi:cobalt-zinc-cadmium efflux system protein